MSNEAWLRNDVCSVARTLEFFGDRWTILVLRDAFLGRRRFDDLHRTIGCARNILADRLRKLVAAGILERRLYQERPRRFEYRLTERGLDLYPALVALMQWGDKHLGDGEGPAVVLEHKACAHLSEPRMVCSHCREPIDARGMRALPGPAALPA